MKGILLQSFIIHQYLCFGGFAFKIEFAAFMYELTNYLYFSYYLGMYLLIVFQYTE